MKKNMIVGQSGGPTAVINGSLYGVVSAGLNKTDDIEHVYGKWNRRIFARYDYGYAPAS